MRILPIPLDLCRTREPLGEADDWLRWLSKIPAVHIAVHCTGSEDVRVMSGEVDVGYGIRVSVQSVFNRGLR